MLTYADVCCMQVVLRRVVEAIWTHGYTAAHVAAVDVLKQGMLTHADVC
jgi:hypothetical protein